MKRIIQLSVLSLSIVSIFGCGALRNNILIPQQLPKEDEIAKDLENRYLTYGQYETKEKKIDSNGDYVFDTQTNDYVYTRKLEESEIAKYIKNFKDFKEDNSLDDKEKEVLKLERNAIIGNLIILLNIRYSQYERAFYNTDSSLGSAFDITTLVVTATGSVAGGAQTKSILSAIAAGLTGSRLALEKNFLYEKTCPVLIARMRKLRETKLTEIRTNMDKEIVTTKDSQGKSIEGYSLEQGLMDVQDYFYKGTVMGALQDMSTEITVTRSADDMINDFVRLKTKVDDVFKGTGTSSTTTSTSSTTTSIPSTTTSTTPSGGGQ